jgi:hypothetical protein
MHSPDIERIRAETPVCRNLVHLNDAGAALMPTPVYDAVRAHLDLECQIGGYEAAEAAQADIERVCADGGWYPITLGSQGARWTGPESVDLERTAHRNENWEDVIGIGPFGTLGTWPSSARARRLRNLPRKDPFILEGIVKSFVIRDWNDTMLPRLGNPARKAVPAGNCPLVSDSSVLGREPGAGRVRHPKQDRDRDGSGRCRRRPCPGPRSENEGPWLSTPTGGLAIQLTRGQAAARDHEKRARMDVRRGGGFVRRPSNDGL